MCTVTFLQSNGQTFITSNRDESPLRKDAGLVSRHDPNNTTIYFPLDESSGGSWVALSQEGRAVCLLNGGFEPFIPSPPYRLSRGQVVLEAVRTHNPTEFLDTFDLDKVAPFTLLVYNNGVLKELVWTGTTRHINHDVELKPQIWSSATLYPEHVRVWRRSLFKDWLDQHPAFDRDSIISFHQMPGGDPRNDFIMDREGIVKTLSVTSIVLGHNQGSIVHLDLERDTLDEIKFRHDG